MTFDDLPGPVCDCHIHDFGPFAPAPPAQYWADWHGCRQSFTCHACLTAIADRFPRQQPITCTGCGDTFTEIKPYLTWRPL
ncbi:hypothetical protein IU449_26995 [Nocardia higoensis]|uniref:Amidohydrolase n=1 Tax=Nocardia higoensis TaxID=228599 RepID=A0ABS0DI59_9NOCA|nr:hypothetical protein [Nocardia higoensis]MBF6358148.1 hypothetical protein [Nocardia higoensis]